MLRTFTMLTVAATLVVSGRGFAGAQQAAAAFSDDACPGATPVGRHLNELNAQAKPSNDELMATSKQLVQAYRDCAKGYDRDTQSRSTSDQSSDYVVIRRMYSRLALARALDRVASYAASLHDSATARADYAEGVTALDEVEGIGAGAQGALEGSEARLLAEARDLRGELQKARRTLPAGGATTAPRPSASPHR